MKPSPSEPGPGESAQYQPPLPCRVSMFEPSPAAGLLHTCLLKEPVLEPLGSLPSSQSPSTGFPTTIQAAALVVQQCLGSSASLSVPGDGALSLSSHTSFLLFAWGGGVSSTRSWATVGMQDLSPGLMVRLLEKPTFLFCSKRFAFYEKNHST